MGSNINEIVGIPNWSCVTPDGKYIFLIARDVYWVSAKVIEELKPKESK